MRTRLPFVGIGIVLVVLVVIGARLAVGAYWQPDDAALAPSDVEAPDVETPTVEAPGTADPSPGQNIGDEPAEPPPAEVARRLDPTRDPVDDVVRAPPSGPLPQLAAIDPRHEAYLRIDLSPELDDSMPREEQDDLLRDALRAKKQELDQLEQFYAEILADAATPAEVRRTVLERLGDLQDHMGVSLIQSTPPSYLTEDQLEVYQDGMKRLADAHFEEADRRWAEAAGD